MSLKAIHVFFISLCVVLAFGFAFWGISQYRTDSNAGNLVLSVSAFIVGGALLFYLASFIKKMRKLP